VTSHAGQPDWTGALGHYAGAASRFAAYAVDVILSWGAFTLGLAGVTFAIRIVTGRAVSWHLGGSIAVGVVFAIWELTYFGYCWAAAERTPGMALFGLRVVRADGAPLDPWRGVVRAVCFPLSVLVFGLGFLGILVQREHRALHDLLAGTAVIYSWDARATRLRFLARAGNRPRLGLATARLRPSPARGEGLRPPHASRRQMSTVATARATAA
jgi:uncharacterized RDD family membrane protein YckC